MVSRQECERQQCERHQCEANSANANSAKGSTVRMPTVRMRQRCECQQCECDSSAKDDCPNCAKPFPQLRQLDLDFRQAFLSFFTHLLHTRDRRLASEIPLKLSTLVAVDRLTSFDSVRRRCTKALRKQPVRRIEFSASKRTSLNPGQHRLRLLSTGPCLRCVTVHCLASSQRSVTSPRKDTTSFQSTKTDRAVQGSRPTMLAFPSYVNNKRIFFLEDEELCC